MSQWKERITVVILTYNRASELRQTLEKMTAADGYLPIIVVDNASTDGTQAMVAREFPSVKLIRSPANVGGSARNLAVKAAETPYVAFCDDDSWWAPGSLESAVTILDRYPRLAAACARILLGSEEREDPICRQMAASPLPADGLPGPALLGFVACAVVFRRQAYLEAGGYEPRFFVGGEEELLTLDLLSMGWRVAYVDSLTVHHYPSPQRDRKDRHRVVARNAIWVAWLRFPLKTSVRNSWRMLRYALRHGVLLATLRSALRELPWVLRNRRVVRTQIVGWYRQLHP